MVPSLTVRLTRNAPAIRNTLRIIGAKAEYTNLPLHCRAAVPGASRQMVNMKGSIRAVSCSSSAQSHRGRNTTTNPIRPISATTTTTPSRTASSPATLASTSRA